MIATGVRDGDAFDPRWLTVGLPAILGGVRPGRPIELGIGIRGVLLAVRLDSDEVQVTVEPDERPATVVAGEPDVVLGLMAGMVEIDHPGLTVRGDPCEVTAAFRRPTSR